MTEHLTECIYAPEEFDFEQNIVWGGKPCICDRLRACEKRVSSEFLTPMGLAFTGMSDPRYAKGYADGLDAAREAVASMVIETVGNSAATVDQAVAAIDALRESK